MIGRRILLLAFLVCLASACASADDDGADNDDDTTPADDDSAPVDDDQSPDDDTAPPPTITWLDCADFFDALTAALVPDDVRCGVIAAPWDRARRDGPTIEVRFALAPCSGATSAGALAIELGGPDPNLRNLVLLTLQPRGVLAQDLRSRFDLLFVEARGSSTSSTPLVCPADLLGQPYQNEDEYRALVRACLAALPAEFSPAHMSTVDSVDDLDLVRRALGLDRLRLFGNSYGSRYMLEYLRRYGERVTGYLLDSTLPPESTCQHDLDRVLRTVADDCDADPQCPISGDEVWSLTNEVLTQLDAAPLPFGLDAYALTDDLFHLGDTPDVLARWPAVLAAFQAGDLEALIAWHLQARLNLPRPTSFPTDGDSFAFDPYSDNVLCIDHPTWYDANLDGVVLWRLSPPYVPFEQQKWMSRIDCEELHAHWDAAPRVDHAPVVSAVAGLLIAPRLDDATPWTDAVQAIASGLTGATLVPVNADHSVLLDVGLRSLHWSRADQDCLRALVVDWLVAPFDPYERMCVRVLTRRLETGGGRNE